MPAQQWWYCCVCDNLVNPVLSDGRCTSCGHAKCPSCPPGPVVLAEPSYIYQPRPAHDSHNQQPRAAGVHSQQPTTTSPRPDSCGDSDSRARREPELPLRSTGAGATSEAIEYIEALVEFIYKDAQLSLYRNLVPVPEGFRRECIEREIHEELARCAGDLGIESSDAGDEEETQHAAVKSYLSRFHSKIAQTICDILFQEDNNYLIGLDERNGVGSTPAVQSAVRAVLSGSHAYHEFCEGLADCFILFYPRTTRMAQDFGYWDYDWLQVAEELYRIKAGGINVTERSSGSIVNTFQGVIEMWTRTKWDWWPLRQYRPPLALDMRRVSWKCDCGEHRWVDVPDFVAQNLELYLRDKYSPATEQDRRSQEEAEFNNSGSAGSRERGQGSGSQSHKRGSRSLLSPVRGIRSRAKFQLGQLAASTPSNPIQGRSSSSGSQSQPQPTSSSSAYQAPSARCVLLVVERGQRHLLSQIRVHQLDNNTFFQRLRSEYYQLRGWLRNWMSVWRYSHCDFYQFEKFEDSQYAPKRKDDYPSPNDNYDFLRQAINPPISTHEFYCRFYSCYRPNHWSLHLFHACKKATGLSRDALDMIPKKKGALEEHGDERLRFWGLYAREIVCFRWVIGYNVLCVVPMVVFFCLWAFGIFGDRELQNAAVPFTLMVGMLSLFWSLFLGSLRFGMSN